MMGRTHGVHAEPITFGVKLLVWYEEMKRHEDRLRRALETISVGRISGSVGTYIHLDPRVEVSALAKLGLAPARVSTQVLQRDRHAEVISASWPSSAPAWTSSRPRSAISRRPRCSSSRSRSPKARRARPRCRTRRTPSGPSGSRACPGFSGGTSLVALENIPLWHERDISHSSAERVIFPDSFILTDYLLAETTDIIGTSSSTRTG